MITLKEATKMNFKSVSINETFGPLIGTKYVTRQLCFVNNAQFVVKRESKYGDSYELRELCEYGSKLVYIIKD